MSSRFKKGDKVIANNYNAKVLSVKKEKNGYICTVKFDSPFVIPSEMDFEESKLSFKDKTIEYCPICNEKWTITIFNKKKWKDCKKCGKKSEECIKENEKIKNKEKKSTKKHSNDKLLEEFEAMLGNHGYDDDDFGFFD